MATAAAETTPPAATTPRPYRVARREQETRDTWTISLTPAGSERPPIEPGQFVMVYAHGVGEVPISVSGRPGREGPVVLTVRDVGAVTRAVCAAAPGSMLGVRGPYGNRWPVEDAAGGDVVVVAGGIGLAPLRPVLLHVLRRRAAYGDVRLLYGARTPADLLYADELRRWGAAIGVELTVDAPSEGWPGRVGVVPQLIGALARPEETTAFVCGPEIMMRYAAAALVDAGVPAARVMLSLERDMRCGVGLCGHCQLGPTLICRDGPVYSLARVAELLAVREL